MPELQNQTYFAEKLAPQIITVLENYPITRAAVFGSYSLGNFDKTSDVDIIVDLGSASIGLHYFSLLCDLEDALQKSVDLLSFDSLDTAPEEIKQNIKNSMRWFYAV